MNPPQGLVELHVCAQRIWDKYLQLGPGRMDESDYLRLTECASQFDGSAVSEEIAAHVERLLKLADRCCCRSEGLCFITGEAGLVPRKDLHSQFEHSLAALKALL